MVSETTAKDEVEVLEGDEGELEVGRGRDVGRQILLTKLSEVKRSTGAVTVTPDATVSRAVELMKKKRVSAVLVVAKKKPRKLVGLFTERDFLDRALGARGFGRLKVSKVMTRDPEALAPGDSVAYALNKMHVGRYRHVPLVDERGVPLGVISARDLIDFLCELCPEEIMNLPSQPKYAVPRTQEGA
ncbi:MAG TPA: CBS domain-containing protein [Anaeromyxobacteraceae bacterium]|nr:CBS domain-containing protein [Anaeromyxobacteraceae bacterium]